MPNPPDPDKPPEIRATRRRGFAAMDPALRSAIASKGGKRAHELGVAHEWKSEEATTAGKKGAAARGRSAKP